MWSPPARSHRATRPPPGIAVGPAKLHLHENALPDFDQCVAFLRAAHDQGRAIASHCTTETELVFTLAALAQAGAVPGDRIEHAGITPDLLLEQMVELGVQVVSQPHFIAERGDQYLRDVEPRERPLLYRLGGFARAGLVLAAGSDAPYGVADPWAAMRAAVSRETADGAVIGQDEALTPEAALALYHADPLDLRRQRSIAIGAPTDLCLLDRPWGQARVRLLAQDVAMTWIGGSIVHDRINQTPA
ncbi:amidohydrolase family protein [Sphingobium scionense]